MCTGRRSAARSAGRIALAVVALAACGDDRPPPNPSPPAALPAAPPAAPPSAPAAPSASAATPAYAVQLGSYGDSAAAERVARALVDSGWAPLVHPAPVGGARRWRVYVAATAADSAFPELMAAGVRVTGGEALVVRDTFLAGELGAEPAARAVRVNGGSPGMVSRARWILSPDGSTLLATEDPVGVENEPVPNGFVLASETLDCYLQVDSVWDVAPAPGWRRVAFGRAYGVRGSAGRESLTAAWPPLAARLGLSADSVRRASFAASGMSYARALAQPAVVDLGASPLEVRMLPMAGGWRVRWSPDGETLGVGTNPRRAQDDETSRGWIAVRDSAPPRLLGAAGGGPLARTRWVAGPVLDASVPVELKRGGAGADGVQVTNEGGWIRIADATGGRRIVGPGVALASTTSGRFVLALAPHANALRDAPTAQLVVYATAAGGRPAGQPCRGVDPAR